MAEYKVINATQLDTDLQSIADKLKEKAGTTEPLTFPNGFIEAADSIQVGGDDGALMRSILDRSITSFRDTKLTKLGYGALMYCRQLATVDLPNVVSLNTDTFYACQKLAEVRLPLVESVGDNAFKYCTALTTLVLGGSTVCSIKSSALIGTPITSGTGYIYVPKALIEEYKAAENWSTFAAQFRAIEDYPEITGGNNNG